MKTGEEEEELLYSHRAKLYRWLDGEWKERGLGDIKLLFDPAAKRVRLLMRREPVCWFLVLFSGCFSILLRVLQTIVFWSLDLPSLVCMRYATRQIVCARTFNLYQEIAHIFLRPR